MQVIASKGWIWKQYSLHKRFKMISRTLHLETHTFSFRSQEPTPRTLTAADSPEAFCVRLGHEAYLHLLRSAGAVCARSYSEERTKMLRNHFRNHLSKFK